jgi:CheY-like chemotaxis protein/anti-sigma regulatory factor (Ser/Thr protein kinase)
MATQVGEGRRVLIVDDDRALRLAVGTLLRGNGYSVVEAGDGPSALQMLGGERVDLMLLDIGLPGMNGLEVLTHARGVETPPRVVMVTSDDTPDAVLRAVRGQAERYIRKPIAPNRIVEVVDETLTTTDASLPIEVVSARPEWLELIAPCSLTVRERIQEFVMHLEGDLPVEVRESVGQAFRELLTNAIEWGGKLDSSRTVRIACVRTPRMLLYRIADPGEGFDISRLAHAAINNPSDDPLKHAFVREEMGLRPGGLGLAMTLALVDEVVYNEKRNEVILVKYLNS